MGVAVKDLSSSFSQFCSTTSIQGVRNITDTKQGHCSQVCWFVIVIVSFICAGISIKESIDGALLKARSSFIKTILPFWHEPRKHSLIKSHK